MASLELVRDVHPMCVVRLAASRHSLHKTRWPKMSSRLMGFMGTEGTPDDLPIWLGLRLFIPSRIHPHLLRSLLNCHGRYQRVCHRAAGIRDIVRIELLHSWLFSPAHIRISSQVCARLLRAGHDRCASVLHPQTCARSSGP